MKPHYPAAGSRELRDRSGRDVVGLRQAQQRRPDNLGGHLGHGAIEFPCPACSTADDAAAAARIHGGGIRFHRRFRA